MLLFFFFVWKKWSFDFFLISEAQVVPRHTLVWGHCRRCVSKVFPELKVAVLKRQAPEEEGTNLTFTPTHIWNQSESDATASNRRFAPGTSDGGRRPAPSSLPASLWSASTFILTRRHDKVTHLYSHTLCAPDQIPMSRSPAFAHSNSPFKWWPTFTRGIWFFAAVSKWQSWFLFFRRLKTTSGPPLPLWASAVDWVWTSGG